MAKKEHIVRYSAKQLAAMKSHSDWARLDGMSAKEVTKLADEEDGVLPIGWEKTVMLGIPSGKEAIKLRIDREVLDWFKSSGKGYQTRMNNVLSAFMKSQMSRESSKKHP